MKKTFLAIAAMICMAAAAVCVFSDMGLTLAGAAGAATNNAEVGCRKMNMIIKAGGREFTASMEDNAATRALAKRLPMTVVMQDLYEREMCYRLGAHALPVENLRSDRYEVGDIIYWAPGGSLVILYEQNGEEFTRQQLGHIASGVEFFKTTGDIEVTFELRKEQGQ